MRNGILRPIIQPVLSSLLNAHPQGGGGGGLQPLTFSTTTYTIGGASGTEIATLVGKSSGSDIIMSGAAGQFVLTPSGKLVVGLLPATPGTTVELTLIEILGSATRTSTVNISVQSVSALDPMAASIQPKLVAGFIKVNPAYNGIAMVLRDSAGTDHDLPFKLDGSGDYDAPAATWSTYGDGTTFRLVRMYDQMTGQTISDVVRPRVIFPNAPTNYNGAYLDPSYVGATGPRTQATFDVGGTANIAAFVVASRQGYTSATYPMAKPGTPSTTAVGKGVLLGYGTTALALLTSCSLLGNGQHIAQSFNANRDSLGRSASIYDLPEWLAIDEAAPSAVSGFECLWMNQIGDSVSGGGDTRLHHVDRLHGVAAANGVTLTFGASGASSQHHNGGIKLWIVYQNASGPLPKSEAHRIAVWCQNRLGTQQTVKAARLRVSAEGQSNMAAQFVQTVVGGSGDGTANTQSLERSFKPWLAARLGIPTERILISTSLVTAVGGTATLKRMMPGDPEQPSWWDEDTNGPGSLDRYRTQIVLPAISNGGSGFTVGDVLSPTTGTVYNSGPVTQLRVTAVDGTGKITAWALDNGGQYDVAPTTGALTGGTGTGAIATIAYNGGALREYDKFLLAMRYNPVLQLKAQGEAECGAVITDARATDWINQFYADADYHRNYWSQPLTPIVIQPIARYDGGPGSARRKLNHLQRRLQSGLVSRPNVFIAPDTGHIARGTGTNFEAHLGPMVNYDPTTGGAEDGYQRVAKQNALASAHALKVAYGIDLAQTDIWRGPEIAEAKLTASNKVAYRIAFPAGCGGTDVSTVSGQYGGFRVTIGGTEYYPTAYEKKTISGDIYIEATYGVTVPVGTETAYEPNYASGNAEGANVRNQLVDNYADLNLPVPASSLLAVAA